MSFRTLEITNPTEIHIKNNQLELTQENRQISVCNGAYVREL